VIDKTRHKNHPRNPSHEKGQVLVLIGLALVVLMIATGLATDATLIYKAKQDLQRTVDSAALAAAYKLPDTSASNTAANEFARLHGYDTAAHPLTIVFPTYTPARKAVSVSGSADVNMAFMSLVGIHTMTISAVGEAEAAPLDVYLVFDLSESMVYDTAKPSPWPPAGFSACSSWDSSGMSDCVAKYCNWANKCDPLDLHIKPAAKFFIDKLDARYDRVGVVAYNQQGWQVIALTNNFAAVKTAIDNLDAFDHQGSSNCTITRSPSYSDNACNKQTNIGDGILWAHDKLSNEGNKDAIWSIILMTDGKANVYRQTSTCNTCPPSCGTTACQYVHLCDECTNAENWAILNAKDTWKRNETVIYTIAYGTVAPGFEDLMIDIADWTDNGTYEGHTANFWAAPDEAHLRTAFAEIADRIFSRLIK
jgi:Putative Flp pilus-assembly TadE/G-like